MTSAISGTIGGVSLHLGLDLGGTNLKWAVVEGDRRPSLVRTGTVPTDTGDGERGVLTQMIRVARGVISDMREVTTIGVGMPGVLDPVAGVTRFIPNIPGHWEGLAVIDEVNRAVEVPARLINDARAFTLAEHRIGSGRGATSMLGITLGTGVGGGLILNGRLYLGDGTAGEFGHQTIVPDGPRCNCGNRGCLEALAKADAISAACGWPGVKESVAAARAGDAQALQGFEDAGRYLGIGAANVVVMVSVDTIVVGGGIAAAGDLLLAPMRSELAQRVRVTDASHVRVVGGELGTWAGAIGAALHGSTTTI
jgi:glucokinase